MAKCLHRGLRMRNAVDHDGRYGPNFSTCGLNSRVGAWALIEGRGQGELCAPPSGHKTRVDQGKRCSL